MPAALDKIFLKGKQTRKLKNNVCKTKVKSCNKKEIKTVIVKAQIWMGSKMFDIFFHEIILETWYRNLQTKYCVYFQNKNTVFEIGRDIYINYAKFYFSNDNFYF